LLVLGSLRPGEAVLLARAWRSLPKTLRQGWQVAAIPRHARAAGGLEEETRRAGFSNGARSTAGDRQDWRWDARAGVLAEYYRAAEVAFVGGSLVPRGGHNPLEPAACETAVVMGAHHATQSDAVERLRACDGILIATSEAELRRAFERLLGNHAERQRRARAARLAVDALRGAARRTVERLGELGFWPPP
jgi:3-deoxy-D-manno-octulosonic-acid transferase